MTAKTTRTNKDYIKDLVKRYQNDVTLAAGIPVGSKSASIAYPDGTELLDVAVTNNFGTDKVPRRDYMTPGGQNAVKKTAPIAKQQVLRINMDEQTVEGALKIMGPVAQAEMSLAVRDLRTPPNAERTIAEKGSDNPLVDTGLLQQSQTWVVRRK